LLFFLPLLVLAASFVVLWSEIFTDLFGRVETWFTEEWPFLLILVAVAAFGRVLIWIAKGLDSMDRNPS